MTERADPLEPETLRSRRGELAAIFFILSESAIFTVIFASEKLFGDEIPIFQLQFLRFFTGLLLLLALVAYRRRRLLDYRSELWRVQVLRSVLGVSAGAAALQAPLWAPLLDVTAVQLLDGVILLALGLIFLHERLVALHWLGSALLMSGAVMVVLGQGAFAGGSGAYSLYWAGLALSALVALFFALEALLTRVLAQRDRPMVIMLHINAIASLLLLGPAIWLWTDIPFLELLPYLLLGPMGLIGQFCYVRACALAPVSLIGPVEYSRLIFAGLLGLLVFQQMPSTLSLIGAGVLLTGGVILARR